MFRTWLHNPLAELQQLIEVVDRVFGATPRSVWSQKSEETPTFFLPVDIYESGNNLYVRAMVPGVKPEDVDVTVENGVLTISGEIPTAVPDDTRWYRNECYHGKFSRSIQLPSQLETQNMSAEFVNGVLTVTIPGIEALRPKAFKVPINAGQPAQSALESGSRRNGAETHELVGAKS